ncbi:hypothetical protein E1A91_D06G138600v1 [Gossypium mustelinum]|uniref:Uncharacterized protein n=3 Tax=Gossypium TaxID=3633 RepID=A0A5J5R308_GOSBA|nr:hypothetical protein ES319_D06G137300v1 [Gossypium barbadense]TYG64945.1 hypothetical protein ES288_D06G146400v1 [Gossypium darwinii]TYI77380.1 hypothetical protein E1A91_D06G138600v1 [Gossypium mustelinum]
MRSSLFVNEEEMQRTNESASASASVSASASASVDKFEEEILFCFGFEKQLEEDLQRASSILTDGAAVFLLAKAQGF